MRVDISMNRCLIILLTVFSCLSVNCSAQNLSLHLNLDSNTFIESQDIWVTASVLNQSSDTQRVRREILENTLGGLRFSLHEDQGKEIAPTGDVTGGDWSEISISPHDSITKSHNIRGEFNTSGNYGATNYLPSVHYLKAGWYSLDAKTFTGSDTLRSTRVRFEIRKPDGKEERILRYLKRADSMYAIDRNKSIEQYLFILERYPQSVYIPYVYSRLIFIYRWVKEDKSRELDLVENFAKRHPNNSSALREVRSYVSEFIKFNRKGVIESLARNHPNTRVGKYCKQKLEELKIIRGE